MSTTRYAIKANAQQALKNAQDQAKKSSLYLGIVSDEALREVAAHHAPAHTASKIYKAGIQMREQAALNHSQQKEINLTHRLNHEGDTLPVQDNSHYQAEQTREQLLSQRVSQAGSEAVRAAANSLALLVQAQASEAQAKAQEAKLASQLTQSVFAGNNTSRSVGQPAEQDDNVHVIFNTH